MMKEIFDKLENNKATRDRNAKLWVRQINVLELLNNFYFFNLKCSTTYLTEKLLLDVLRQSRKQQGSKKYFFQLIILST